MSKRIVVTITVVGIVLVLLAGSRTWVNGSISDAVLTAGKVRVSGNKAAPACLAATLVSAAALVASLTTGRVARTISSVLGVCAALIAAAATAVVIHDPVKPVRGQVSTLTGHTGDAAVHASLTPWPWVALLGAVIAACGSALAWSNAKRWRGLSASYEAPVAGSGQTVSDWDRLSAGEDPTDDPAEHDRTRD